MEPITSSAEGLLQSLREVDCTPAQIEKIAVYIAEGDGDMARRVLRQHRKTLMEGLHASQQKVDKLDFLIYSLPELKCVAQGGAQEETL